LVKAGQVLLLTDASVLKQQMAQLETQLSFAEDIYKRQQNLWNQNIGTEVQLLTAKNNVEAVNRQISTLREQIALTRITAPISGVVDELNVKVGETFQGYLGTIPQIKIINTRKGLKVMSDIPENYAAKVKVGTPVEIIIPDISKNVKSTISLVGQTIGLTSRAFNVESKIPFDAALKPNQLAQMRIQDYTNAKAIVVPVNVVQTDEKGKYVFVMVVENNQKVARRKIVTIGEMYSSNIEVTSGLAEGDQVITQGYQSLYEGQPLETGAN
jgi:membrane fusion protein, multidrug efflux system